MRNFISLIESQEDSLLTHDIAAQVADGNHEGFKPYWKLHADERVLSDEGAMHHIATLISDGYTSGAHPHWELKVVDAPVDMETEIEEATAEIDEKVHDIVHAHMVVPVAETHGPGKGWYEVSDAEATHWVVEDEFGEPVNSFETRADAEQHASDLNSGMAVSDMRSHAPEVHHELIEDDEVLGDEVEETRFANSENFVVILNAIHERGERQDEAIRELHQRGLWLSPEQWEQAGRPESLTPPEV